MKKKNLLIALIVMYNISFAQNFWNKTSPEILKSASKMNRASIPKKYELYSLDFSALKSKLSQTKRDNKLGDSNIILAFPTPYGNMENYAIYEAPVMDDELSSKYPDIKSYVGVGIDDPSATIRFSVTLFGLHTMTFSGKAGVFLIDTYTTDNQNYIAYNKSDTQPSRSFQCLVNDSFNLPKSLITNNESATQKASDSKFRTFRLAMACTIEYAAYHVSAAGLNGGTLAQKKGAVLAAMNVTMTRVNGVYERDMSLRMVLIANNDNIIFIDSDNFTNDDASALIDESQAQITSIIGDNNFDIGHTVSTGGGGLAGPSPCVTGQKASGITGSGAPVGDAYDIDYVAHEMGHQFGANHTFNGDADNCGGGNRNNPTAVEPGSGTTIMAYAGICAPQNVQNNSDDHFHAVSIVEMVSLINASANCAVTINNGNTPPVANAGLDFTIPKGTAFVLKGSATDVNGDALTYCWEQTDNQISIQPPVQTATVGPNYRSKSPTTSPDRFLPPLANVVVGNLAPTWEVTPTVARIMNFALTVRDNRIPNGGQTSRDNTIITVNGTAGPFVTTSQNTSGISYTGLSNQSFTWNVAGTTANGVNTANVKITLSTDNGLTFPTVLAASTPNDGSEIITIPNGINSINCRVKIEAVGNLFYSVNSTKFTITPALSLDDFEFQDFVLSPNPNKGSFSLRFTSNSNTIKINVHDLRGRQIFEKSYSNNFTFNQNITLENIQSGVYLVIIADGNHKSVKRIIIE